MFQIVFNIMFRSGSPLVQQLQGGGGEKTVTCVDIASAGVASNALDYGYNLSLVICTVLLFMLVVTEFWSYSFYGSRDPG